MLEYLRRRREDDQGFTLIELMVVVLIIAILIAIAIPTFLGAQDRARDRGAQSDLRNMLTAARTISTDHEGFFKTAATCTGNEVDAAALSAEEASISVTDGLTPANNVVGVDVPDACQTLQLVRQSTSDTWFGLVASKDGSVNYCKGDAATDVNVSANCTADSW